MATEKTAARRIFLPGTTTHGHYQIELDCGACHTTSWEMKQDACLDCHAAELEAARDTHPQSKFNDPTNATRLSVIDAQNCLTCHKEHVPGRTSAMGLSLPKDYCFHCHSDVAESRPSHAGMAFDSCASAGCHNYHDNTALYENFLKKHYGEPDVLAEANLPARDFGRKARERFDGEPLNESDQDSPLPTDQVASLIGEWSASGHAAVGVNCGDCHHAEQDAAENRKPLWSDAVSHESCRRCHEPEVDGWLGGLHGMRLSRGLTPMTPKLARLPMKGAAAHAKLRCNSCHSGHRFDTKFAAVDACLRCHDDRHSLAYRQSEHFALWEAENGGGGPAGSGVSCATCHMPRTKSLHHGRVVVNHNQNANLRPNEKMVRTVCMNCHGLEFAIDSLADRSVVDGCFQQAPSNHIESAAMAKRWFEAKDKARRDRRKRNSIQ